MQLSFLLSFLVPEYIPAFQTDSDKIHFRFDILVLDGPKKSYIILEQDGNVALV